MLEAKITCLARSYILNDLGRTLLQGEILHLPRGEVECSKDLQRAQVIRAVHIQWVQRCQQVKEPEGHTPPYMRRLKGNLPTKEIVREREIIEKDPDLEKVRVVVQQVVSEELVIFKQELLEAFEGIVGSLPGRPVAAFSEEKDVAAQHTAPTFVPSGIVKTNLDASISTEREVQPRSTLDNAAQALRAAKKSGGLSKDGEEKE
jgi:hypothetical protein